MFVYALLLFSFKFLCVLIIMFLCSDDVLTLWLLFSIVEATLMWNHRELNVKLQWIPSETEEEESTSGINMELTRDRCDNNDVKPMHHWNDCRMMTLINLKSKGNRSGVEPRSKWKPSEFEMRPSQLCSNSWAMPCVWPHKPSHLCSTPHCPLPHPSPTHEHTK